MKAVVLAAGLGTRLGDVTREVPKCLLPMAGRPILAHHLDALAAAGVDEAVVNTHHLHEQVEAFVRGRSGPPRVRLAHEPELLGTAGTLRANAHVLGDGDFLIVYADCLTDADLGMLAARHRELGYVATLALFHAEDPRSCGIATLEGDRITAFEEKPDEPRGDLAFAGLAAASPVLLDAIGPDTPLDLGRHVFPSLAGRLGGWIVPGYLRDIGTPDALKAASRDAPGVLR